MFSNLIFSKEIDSNFVFKKYIPSLKSMWRHWCFVLSKFFAISATGEKIILKSISEKEESEEADEFHDSQKCLRQTSITVQKIMETWHFFVFFHHSACQKCFFTAKCSPSQGVPSPLERPNIRDQTCPKIKCEMRSKQGLVTKNTSPA